MDEKYESVANGSIISIIVPVYKVEKYLRKCLDSLVQQTYKNIEIILVDDGSPDLCPEICEQYKKSDDRIKVIHKRNGGLASARNTGLDCARGEFIAFVDSDDWVELDIFEKLIKTQKDTDADIVMFNMIRTDGKNFFDPIYNCYFTGNVVDAKEIAKQILLDTIGSQVVRSLYSVKCWDGVRFPIGRLYEDIPTTYLAYEKAKTVSFVNEFFYKYRVNTESISYTANPLKSYHIFLGFKDHFDYCEIHYPDIIKKVGAKAAHYGISVYYHACSDGKDVLESYKKEVEDFLIHNKGLIDFSSIMLSRRVMLFLFYTTRPLFRFICKILYLTGLQRILKLGVK